MTLDDLLEVFNKGVAAKLAAENYPHEAFGTPTLNRAGIAAVVRALRDEFGRIMYPGDDWNRQGILEQFDQILGAAGDEAAGGSTSDGGTATEAGGARCATPCASAPAAAPAPAVCVWKQDGWEYRRAGCNGWSAHIYSPKYSPPGNKCPHCKAPIKFTEESK